MIYIYIYNEMDVIIMFWGIIVYIYRLIPKAGIFMLYIIYVIILLGYRFALLLFLVPTLRVCICLIRHSVLGASPLSFIFIQLMVRTGTPCRFTT